MYIIKSYLCFQFAQKRIFCCLSFDNFQQPDYTAMHLMLYLQCTYIRIFDHSPFWYIYNLYSINHPPYHLMPRLEICTLNIIAIKLYLICIQYHIQYCKTSIWFISLHNKINSSLSSCLPLRPNSAARLASL